MSYEIKTVTGESYYLHAIVDDGIKNRIKDAIIYGNSKEFKYWFKLTNDMTYTYLITTLLAASEVVDQHNISSQSVTNIGEFFPSQYESRNKSYMITKKTYINLMNIIREISKFDFTKYLFDNTHFVQYTSRDVYELISLIVKSTSIINIRMNINCFEMYMSGKLIKYNIFDKIFNLPVYDYKSIKWYRKYGDYLSHIDMQLDILHVGQFIFVDNNDYDSDLCDDEGDY